MLKVVPETDDMPGIHIQQHLVVFDFVKNRQQADNRFRQAFRMKKCVDPVNFFSMT